jgi:TolB protein
LFATVAVIALLLAAPASATFPGKNGPISFNRFAELPGDQLVTNLFAVDPDGSDLSQLTDFGAETFSELSDHSPDGRTLAFQRFDFVGEESRPPQIWLTDADGSHARQLTDIANGAFDPAFAPDGRTLAIDSDIGGAPGIFLIPAKAQGGKLVSDAQARRVTRGPAGGFDSEPQISPDGKWLVFTRYSAECADDTPEDCQTRIYKVRTNGKDLKLLVGPDLNPSAPDWHPTGLVIAFDTHDNTVAPDDGHIMVMLANGSLKHVIVRADADSYYQNPSFSPDGTRIAYAHWPLTPEGNADETLRSSIWTAWVTGAKPKQITRGEWDNKPDWGPAPRRH